MENNIRFRDYVSEYKFKERAGPDYKETNIKFSGNELKDPHTKHDFGIEEESNEIGSISEVPGDKKEQNIQLKKIKYSSVDTFNKGIVKKKKHEVTGNNSKKNPGSTNKKKNKNDKLFSANEKEPEKNKFKHSGIKYYSGKKAVKYIKRIGNSMTGDSFGDDYNTSYAFKEVKGLKDIVKKMITAVVSVASGAIVSPIIISVLVCILLASFTVTIISTIEEMNRTAVSVSPNSSNYEERLIYLRLYDYFWDSETSTENTAAVIGIMCNIDEESGFQANNLQNGYETILGMGDVEYTEKVNSGEYSKDSFINDSAGYGYCQYTYWSKKQSFYEYADNWFNNEDGLGYGQSFDIGSPEMQSYYVVYLLDELYPSTAEKLKELSAKYDQSSEEGWANAVYEATYIFLTEYELPSLERYDASGHKYYTTYEAIARERANNASAIYEACTSTYYSDYDGSFAALEGTYFIQCESGPCVMCSVFNMLKRYCYMNGDADWDSITPDLITDNGVNLHDSYVVSGNANCGWGCFDSSGSPHLAIDTGFSGPTGSQTINIHNIACNIQYCSGQISKDQIIALLAEHPEGIAVTCSYAGGAHGKLITRYDYDSDTFYTVDSGAWGSSQHSYLGGDAAGRYEMPLDSSRCWYTSDLLNNMLYYRYLE